MRGEQAPRARQERNYDLVGFSATQQAPVIMLTPVQHSYKFIMLIPLQHCQGAIETFLKRL